MRCLLLAALAVPAFVAAADDASPDVVDIGSRRELFVDDQLLETLDGVERRLHHPEPRGVVLTTDAPWEGNTCAYFTVFRDGELYRMYYRGSHIDTEEGRTPHEEFVCYAESDDGHRWRKPELDLVEFRGSKANNIIRRGLGSHDFTPFLDANPEAPPGARYKALGRGHPVAERGLYAFTSSDGLHWSLASREPIITEGAFDSQNLAFWDPVREEYRAYFRDFRDGKRDVRTATSEDFREWSDPVWLEYPGAEAEHLYTNQIAPYYRAPHIFIGFPTRYIDRPPLERFRTLPDFEARRQRAAHSRRWGTAITETLLMSSRDGRTFARWAEAFLRPGPRTEESWAYGNNYTAWHAVETASPEPGMPRELSLYASEGYWTGESMQVRRYRLRIDGFVSLHAPMRGGEAVTRPLRFQGERLELNLATSAAGGVRVGILDPDGEPIEGLSADDAREAFGDQLARTVEWTADRELAGLAGKPVRLRFVLRDADLYSFRFAPAE